MTDETKLKTEIEAARAAETLARKTWTLYQTLKAAEDFARFRETNAKNIVDCLEHQGADMEEIEAAKKFIDAWTTTIDWAMEKTLEAKTMSEAADEAARKTGLKVRLLQVL